MDTDGNGLITPNDVLQVINYLNANTSHARRSGEGEGEAAFTTAPAILYQSAFPSQLVMTSALPASLPLVPAPQTRTVSEPATRPTTATSASPSIFAQVADSRSSGVDISWVTQRSRVEDSNSLTDIALASLLADFDDAEDE